MCYEEEALAIREIAAAVKGMCKKSYEISGKMPVLATRVLQNARPEVMPAAASALS